MGLEFNNGGKVFMYIEAKWDTKFVEMPTKIMSLLQSGSREKNIIFGGHLQKISPLLILSGL